MADSQSSRFITAKAPKTAVREFFERLGKNCVALDYDATEPLFADDVVSFGTKARIVSGLAPLRTQQWEGIWGNIEDFRFDLDAIHAGGDANHAWGVAPWDSTGFDDAGRRFQRPGRATVVLERRGDRWLVVHTHFSLVPGTPPRTFGRKPETGDRPA